MQLALLALRGLLFRLGAIILHNVRTGTVEIGKRGTRRGEGWWPYVIVVGLLILIAVLAEVVLIIVLIEVLLVKLVLVHLLESEGLSSKPVDGTGNELLLNVLTQLVVKLEALLNVGSGIVVVLGGCIGGREEVEKRLGGNSLLDNTSLFCVCIRQFEI